MHSAFILGMLRRVLIPRAAELGLAPNAQTYKINHNLDDVGRKKLRVERLTVATLKILKD